jgi:signal transduction histidine kinase
MKGQKMKVNIGIVISSISICLLTILGCVYYLNRTYNNISQIISDFISKRKIEATDVADTRESKLISQLKQLIMITDHEIKSAMEEREVVTTLISDLSHQLKTPLSNITMFTELLKDSSLLEEEKQEFILRTGEQAAKMEWLLQALLKTSRLETGLIEFDVAPNYIKETIADSISSVYSHAESKNIRIRIDEFQDLKLMHNPKWTAESISNILENAIKYSCVGTTIEIRIEPMELYTKIVITDQGIGIAPEEYPLIFKRFYRSKQVEQKAGSGLGLYLSQLILAKEGGYVTVNSVLGEGSCFSLFLLKERETIV